MSLKEGQKMPFIFGVSISTRDTYLLGKCSMHLFFLSATTTTSPWPTKRPNNQGMNSRKLSITLVSNKLLRRNLIKGSIVGGFLL